MITSPSGSASLLSKLLDKLPSVLTLKLSLLAIGGVLLNVAGSFGSIGAFKSRTSIDTEALSVLPKVSITL